ncbi:PAAR domain-containing protein [Andreprevotia chitinilytica]|uniref:PAAR domain-containing protein n=1 Tax=Andreprevotia chitinilytica TaxID=396808 RepID=UPI00054CDACB|nr:PAAR domain-containing protein [Andreprevotia chitinilytica]
MGGIIRLFDKTSHNGHVKSASSTLDIEGRIAAVIGDIVSCPIHGDNPIVEGDASWLDEGRAIVVDGCKTACGSVVISSLPETGSE